MAAIESKLKNIDWLLLDVDGVLTDGKLFYDHHGESIKVFDVQDGHGIKMLKSIGLKVGVISGRGCKALETRLKELKIDWYVLNCEAKDEALKKGVKLHGEEILNSAHIGDDTPDLALFNQVKVSIAPSNAHNEVLSCADIILKNQGGNGAVREACDMIFTLKKGSK